MTSRSGDLGVQVAAGGWSVQIVTDGILYVFVGKKKSHLSCKNSLERFFF